MSKWLNAITGLAVSSNTESVSHWLDQIEKGSDKARHEAIEELYYLSNDPKNCKEFGVGIKSIVNAIKDHKDCVEDTRIMIQVLINIMTQKGGFSDSRVLEVGSDEYENLMRFESEYTVVILGLLGESDKKVRFFSTKFLTILFTNRPQEVECSVLRSPKYITNLVDLLKDVEMIRNEAILLFLEVTKHNVELQKVIAFEEGFEILLSIIKEEGYGNGGIIVQDCLCLIWQLLMNNASNWKHFGEMGYIGHLSELLSLEDSEFWFLTEEKKQIMVLTLKILITLTASSDRFKKQISDFGILQKIIFLVFYQINANVVRYQAICALCNAICKFPENQEIFERQEIQNHNLLVKCVHLMFNSKLKKEKSSILNVIRSYMHNRRESQKRFEHLFSFAQEQLFAIKDLTPPNGSNLVDMLLSCPITQIEWYPIHFTLREFFATPTVNTSLASSFLASLLHHNPKLKSKFAPLFNIFLNRIHNLLLPEKIQNANEYSNEISLLVLLAEWTDENPQAITELVGDPIWGDILWLCESSNPDLLHLSGISAFICSICIPAEIHAVSSSFTLERLIEKLDSFKMLNEFRWAQDNRHYYDGCPPNEESHSSSIWYHYDFDLVSLFSKHYQKVISISEKNIIREKNVSSKDEQVDWHRLLEDNQRLRLELKDMAEENERLKCRIAQLAEENTTFQQENSRLILEQEELFVLLAEAQEDVSSNK